MHAGGKKNLMFKVSMPSLQESDLQFPIADINITFIDDKRVENKTSIKSKIKRTKESTNQVNLEIDKELNRVGTVNALEDGRKIAERGKVSVE